jgi:hypothetical protein
MPFGGFTFINFASVHDQRSSYGTQVRESEYFQIEHGEEIQHSYFDYNDMLSNKFYFQMT